MLFPEPLLRYQSTIPFGGGMLELQFNIVRQMAGANNLSFFIFIIFISINSREPG
jgi:hypothetical protein